MRKPLIIICGTILAVIFAVVCLINSHRQFTSEKWKYVNNPNYYMGHPGRELKREAIYQDLLENYNFAGKSEHQVKKLLGNPDEVFQFESGVEWRYEVVREESGHGELVAGKVFFVRFEKRPDGFKVKDIGISIWNRDNGLNNSGF